MSDDKTVRVAAAADLGDGKKLCVNAAGKALALFQENGKIFAMDNECTHMGGPLCEGEVKDGVVTCPWHGSKFNIVSGVVVQGPAADNMKTYPVIVRGADVFVTLE